MTASAVVSLCNSALDRLGQRPVSLSVAGHFTSPANDLERLCARNFDDVVKSVIAAHPWNCMTTREALTLNTSNPPAFEFDNRFPFPTDKRVCRLESVWLGDYEIKTDKDELYYGAFRIEGQSVITNSDEVSITFTYFPIQTNGEAAATFDTRMGTYIGLIDDALRQVIIYELALALCYPVTNNATLKATLGAESAAALKRALGRDKRENPLPRFANRDIIDVRWGY